LGISFFRSLHRSFAAPKLLGALLFFVSGLSMVHLLLPTYGGVVGTFIANPVIALVDIQATFLFLCAFLVVSLVVMFDTPFHHMAKNLFMRLYTHKDDEVEPSIVSTDALPLQKQSLLKTEEQESSEPKKDIVKVASEEVKAKEDEGFSFFFKKRSGSFNPPPTSLLAGDKGKPGVGDIKANANIIKRTLQNFGIPVEMDEITIGPTVTRYALKPAEGVKLSRIDALQDNLKLALAAASIRIETPIPGKSLVGIEIPNTSKTTVGLGTLIDTPEFQNSDMPLLMALGKTVSGKPYYDNLAKMPHLLIAGTTGAGKSVTVHALLTSLLYRNSPDMLKFIMVDAKRVELTLYNKIPHLLTPVITDAKKTIMALRWAAKEMDRRYDLLEKQTVRDILSYHKNIIAKAKPEDALDPMPYIVIVIDELADLMQAYPRELEGAIVRLAQMSRAVGIHLIISTQRPSVNVITGLIKANIPTRIALKVGSQIDSRTIIDRAGAEKLVGQGDMLYVSQANPDPIRIQSPYISENEVKDVVKFFVESFKDEVPQQEINLGGATEPVDKNAIFTSMNDSLNGGMDDGDGQDDDELYEEAKRIVIEAKRASTSYIQRKLRVGYARAARLMDMLEERGVISAGEGGSKPREILDAGTIPQSVEPN
jgi:S-DNA-T family DNA segregation ATPase FtsK/SpoIIIE